MPLLSTPRVSNNFFILRKFSSHIRSRRSMWVESGRERRKGEESSLNMEGLLIKLMELIISFSLSFQSRLVYSDFRSSQSTQKWIQIKMHCSYVRSSIGGARVHGKKTINLLACIQRNTNGRVELQMQWACNHIQAIVQYGFERQHLNLMMGEFI